MKINNITKILILNISLALPIIAAGDADDTQDKHPSGMAGKQEDKREKSSGQLESAGTPTDLIDIAASGDIARVRAHILAVPDDRYAISLAHLAVPDDRYAISLAHMAAQSNKHADTASCLAPLVLSVKDVVEITAASRDPQSVGLLLRWSREFQGRSHQGNAYSLFNSARARRNTLVMSCVLEQEDIKPSDACQALEEAMAQGAPFVELLAASQRHNSLDIRFIMVNFVAEDSDESIYHLLTHPTMHEEPVLKQYCINGAFFGAAAAANLRILGGLSERKLQPDLQCSNETFAKVTSFVTITRVVHDFAKTAAVVRFLFAMPEALRPTTGILKACKTATSAATLQQGADELLNALRPHLSEAERAEIGER